MCHVQCTCYENTWDKGSFLNTRFYKFTQVFCKILDFIYSHYVFDTGGFKIVPCILSVKTDFKLNCNLL